MCITRVSGRFVLTGHGWDNGAGWLYGVGSTTKLIFLGMLMYIIYTLADDIMATPSWRPTTGPNVAMGAGGATLIQTQALQYSHYTQDFLIRGWFSRDTWKKQTKVLLLLMLGASI